MKIKFMLLTALVLALTSICFAQTKKEQPKKPETKTTTEAPEQVVKNLYAAQKSGKSPFHQTKNRALVDQYFDKDLADMIWKDAVDAKGEAGAIDFDPMTGWQMGSSEAVVGKPREESGPDNVFVKATFEVETGPDSVDYELRRGADKKWRIVGIYYSSGEDLASTLRYAQDAEFKKEFDAEKTFTGEYMVGKMKCNVTRTLSGFQHRVECEGQEGFKLYVVEGSEIETAYINNDEKGNTESKFVFKNGAKDGKFIDAKGKEVKVSPIK